MLTAEERREFVAKLPSRTAHALHALLATSIERNMPVTSAEVVIYDEEAFSAKDTGEALKHAKRLGLAGFTGKYWVPSTAAYELRYELEARYLSEVSANL